MIQPGELFQFIERHRLAVLATVSAEGAPEAALVGIAVTSELEIHFRHPCRPRARRRSCKRTHAPRSWSDAPKRSRCSMKGIAQELTGDDLAKYKQTYFAAFPDGPAREAWKGITYYVVRPRWIRSAITRNRRRGSKNCGFDPPLLPLE